MSMNHCAYLAYGVHVPVDPYHHRDADGLGPGEQVDQALSVPAVKSACPDVGHMSASDCDQDSFYVVTAFYVVGYSPKYLSSAEAVGSADWDRQILHLIDVMGWSGMADSYEPRWFVVLDTY